MCNDNVRAAIEDSGLKQKFVAEKAGISEQTLSAILNGKQKIEADLFFILSDVLKMAPETLYKYQKKDA